jgi:hypothetical protein
VSDVPHAVFEALDRAEPMLLDTLRKHGINHIEYLVGFVKPYRIYVWLCTDTDAQRDALPDHDPFLEEVRSVIDQAGMPHDDAHVEGTEKQSQETVDRKYEGSWFNALR